MSRCGVQISAHLLRRCLEPDREESQRSGHRGKVLCRTKASRRSTNRAQGVPAAKKERWLEGMRPVHAPRPAGMEVRHGPQRPSTIHAPERRWLHRSTTQRAGRRNCGTPLNIGSENSTRRDALALVRHRMLIRRATEPLQIPISLQRSFACQSAYSG